MGTEREHDREIAEAAREVLGTLGFLRKGRSRLWFADYGWWLILVEFQPSGWSRGSYLNVAAHWLWSPLPSWSFDFAFSPATRVNGFLEYQTEDQIRTASRQLADIAAREPESVYHGSTMTPITLARSPDVDIESRRPVWAALSELFLDTSLDSADLNRIAKTLARSRYSLDELDQILLWEVYPACRSNLLSIAGVWAGFDPQWLESRILSRPSPLALAWAGTVGRLGMFSSASWRTIKRRAEGVRLVCHL